MQCYEGVGDDVVAQFNRLLQELIRGRLGRNTFQPWEVQLLLDVESCCLRPSNKRQLLKRYQRAVNRQFDRGWMQPLRFSEYVSRLSATAHTESEPAQ